MPTESATTETTTETTEDTTPNDETSVGKGSKDNVLADLASERDRRHAAEREAKTAKAELKKLQESSLSDAEKAVNAAREEGKQEATLAANGRIVRAEVRAVAADKLADPTDAIRLLDLADFTVDDDGNVDTKAIAKAIDTLVKAKPYLAKNGAGAGDGDGGARGRTTSTTSMNDVIRERMRR